MSKFRTHTCGEITKKEKNKKISISGWINKKRDHGNLLFIDLRDNYGITQCVIDKKSPDFTKIEKLPLETVIKINKNTRYSYEKLYRKDCKYDFIIPISYNLKNFLHF